MKTLSNFIQFTRLRENVPSVCNKGVVVNDVFADHELDMLTLMETWHEAQHVHYLSLYIVSPLISIFMPNVDDASENFAVKL